MKFEKFLKMAAGHGVIVEDNDEIKYLLFDGAMLRIPDGTNIIAPLTMNERPFMTNVLEAFADNEIRPAELTGAKLPTPDASASKVIRVFTDDEKGEIGITNKGFALIEKSDLTHTVYDKDYNDEQPVALVILTGYGDDEEIAGIIFDDDYFATKIRKEVISVWQ
jgi:hypothetical protein